MTNQISKSSPLSHSDEHLACSLATCQCRSGTFLYASSGPAPHGALVARGRRPFARHARLRACAPAAQQARPSAGHAAAPAQPNPPRRELARLQRPPSRAPVAPESQQSWVDTVGMG